MKHLIAVLCCLLMTSCAKDDKPVSDQFEGAEQGRLGNDSYSGSDYLSKETTKSTYSELIGQWQLTRIDRNSFGIFNTIDYSGHYIIYDFQQNGNLSISGGQTIHYPNGNFQYKFGPDYLGSGPAFPGQAKLVVLRIGSGKWIYTSDQEGIKLDKSYVDDDILYLKKIR